MLGAPLLADFGRGGDLPIIYGISGNVTCDGNSGEQ
jgi:hypothetical protein